MKLSNLFMIALLAGTLGVLGCGDDDNGGTAGTGGSGTAGTGGSGTAGTGGSGTAGTGGSGTGGTGGTVGAVEACSGPTCEARDVLRATCEVEFDDCIARSQPEAECIIAAEIVCGNI